MIFLLSCFNPVYAEEMGNAITINSVYNDENGIVVSGNISNKPEEVTILVLDENEEIVYIDQKKSNEDGNFEFRFNMKNPEQYGDYVIRVGGKNVNIPQEMTFNYQEYIPMMEKRILNGDINVKISGYKPTITGSLECFEGRELEMVVLNTTDDTGIANEVILSDDGVFNFTYELPNLIYPKNYNILIECKNGEESLMLFGAEISSSTITVSATGNITLGENVRMTGVMQSANTDLLNKEFNITESESVSLTIPNLVASMECDMNFECFEKIPEILKYSKCIKITGTKDYIYQLPIYCLSADINDINWRILFDKEYFEIDNLYSVDDVKVIKADDGLIEFKYLGTDNLINTLSLYTKKSGNTQIMIYQYN